MKLRVIKIKLNYKLKKLICKVIVKRMNIIFYNIIY